MRVLHAALMAQYEPGVIQQMEWEDAAARKLGLRWDARLFVPRSAGYPSSRVVVVGESQAGGQADGFFGRVRGWVHLRKSFYAWLASQAASYDLILLRHSISDPFRARFVRSVGLPVLSVHHTLEEPELQGRGSLAAKVKLRAERLFGRASLEAVDGLVAVTHEIERYELSRIRESPPTFVYPNGIFFDGDDSVLADRREGATNLIFVASHFVPWHGLDLLLADLRRSDRAFHLHLVGRVSPDDEKVALADSRVVLHGLLGRDEIKGLTARCDLGLASFALHRKNMHEACTLKVREYLSCGVPVYSGHEDVFPQGFMFYRRGKPLLDDILRYADECRSVSRSEVAREAQAFISKESLLGKFHEELVEVFEDFGGLSYYRR